MKGYGGTILRVNLTTGQISKEPTPAEMARDFIGGRGFGVYQLYKEVSKGADALGPENKLIISSRPLIGHAHPGRRQMRLDHQIAPHRRLCQRLHGRAFHRGDEIRRLR